MSAMSAITKARWRTLVPLVLDCPDSRIFAVEKRASDCWHEHWSKKTVLATSLYAAGTNSCVAACFWQRCIDTSEVALQCDTSEGPWCTLISLLSRCPCSGRPKVLVVPMKMNTSTGWTPEPCLRLPVRRATASSLLSALRSVLLSHCQPRPKSSSDPTPRARSWPCSTSRRSFGRLGESSSMRSSCVPYFAYISAAVIRGLAFARASSQACVSIQATCINIIAPVLFVRSRGGQG
mmetsp:Transcript_22182/g.50991  ORF Transcript_22182/g.50991 Transcript_22182/m.50991 type:complete len:236 (-) Transcript_22182:24-731(-)